MKLMFLFILLGSLLNAQSGRMIIIGADAEINGIPINKSSNSIPIYGDYYIVDASIQHQVSNYSFCSKLKEKNNAFSFNIPEIIVRRKDENEDLSSILEAFGNVSVNKYNSDIYVVSTLVENEYKLDNVLKEIRKLDGVKHAQINQCFTLSVTSNDPMYANQWYLENTGTPQQNNGIPGADIEVLPAWNLAKGDSIIVAVMDSGIDTLHPEFQGRLLPGIDAFATDSINTHGYPFTNYDENAHGTACAGIIGAEQDNSIGITGIAPHCKLVPVRFFFYVNFNNQIVPFTNMNALLTGAAYSWNTIDADIISCSAGLTQEYIDLLTIDTTICNQELRQATTQGRGGKGTVLLFSAGNDNIPTVLWPANLKESIAVGASDMCDTRKRPNDCSGESWWGSSYGQTLDFVAPGVKISTCDITGSIGYSSNDFTTSFNGTSAACPVAAGVASLLLDYNPELTSAELKHILNFTAEKVTPYVYDSTTIDGTWNEEVGHGRINAYLALQQAFNANVNEKTTNQIHVYPNPFHDYLIIESESESKGVLFSVDGKFISEIVFNSVNDLSLIPNGIYLLKTEKKSQLVLKR